MTKIDDVLVARMERLVRALAVVEQSTMSGSVYDPAYQDFKKGAADRWTEARAIVAELPAPVDPDLVAAQRYYEEWLRYPGDGPTIASAMAYALRRAREEGNPQ